MKFQFAILLTTFVFAISQTTLSQGQEKVANRLIGNLPIVEVTASEINEESAALRFFPENTKPEKGNAASHYYRAILMMMSRPEFNRASQLFYPASQAPFDKLDAEKLNAELKWFDEAIEELIRGTRQENCDWGVKFYGRDPIRSVNRKIPELYQLRELGRMLIVRAKLAAQKGDYEEALRQLQLNNQLAIHISQFEVLVAGLVATRMIHNSLNAIEQFSRAKGSPNFYNALSGIKFPVVDIPSKIIVEMEYWGNVFPVFQEPAKTKREPAEWNRLVKQSFMTSRLIKYGGFIDDETRQKLEDSYTKLSAVQYPIAYRRLVKSGMEASLLDSMPVAQVIAIDTAQVLENAITNGKKQISLPLGEVDDRPMAMDSFMYRLENFFPAPLNAIMISHQLDQRVAAMANAQIIRHLATRDRLPDLQTLSDDDPNRPKLLNDPATRKEFKIKQDVKGEVSISSSHTNPRGRIIVATLKLRITK